MTRIAPLFVSHGAPTLALAPGAAGAMLTRLGRERPRPAAILVVSAHWEAPAAVVSDALRPRTIHDFHGFPAALYELQYGTPGAPDVAARVVTLLAQAGLGCRTAERGLDHGAWIPLGFLHPEGDIPVTQLAISPALGAAHHLALGRVLAPLADEGVLVLGSGGLTHNLQQLRFDAPGDEAPQWVREFADWVADAVEAGDAPALVDYRSRAPQAARNHPTEEHFLPLLVALGAAGTDAAGRRIPGGVTYGVLAMDAFVMDSRRRSSA
jgi:4,5-DOPA dioxygenase extradiol